MASTKISVSVRLKAEEKAILEKIAEDSDLTVSQLVRKAIREKYFAKDKDE